MHGSLCAFLCLSTIYFAGVHAGLSNVVNKPGRCPVIESGTFGICIRQCGNDGDCPGAEKCCSNGCGTICTKPAKLDCVTKLNECSGKAAGNYRDCLFCDRYVACVGTIGYYMKCPAPLVYNGFICVFPSVPCAKAPTTPPPCDEEKYCYSEVGKETDCLYDIGENAVVTLVKDLGSSTSPYISCTKNVNWLTPTRTGSSRKRLAVRGGCCGIFNINKC